jgi:crotonobetainyl-CoA:carnitine CoA-transferase CaiB-like acyl-CoA transferase
MAAPDALAALTALWRDAALPLDALERIALPGAEPALPSSFAIGTAAQAGIAASALAAAELWRLRTDRVQRVTVPLRDAAIEFRSERYLRLEGQPPPDPWDKIAGAYRCGDGRWVRLHTNFLHHRDGVLALLGCAYEREAVTAALQHWEAEAFEAAASERGLVVAALRTFAEWDAHPQGAAVAAQPVVAIERIGDAPPEPLPPLAGPGTSAPDRPLAGVRVLDLTRVIAGPVCGRTLAVHGADVLGVTAAHLPSIGVMDTGRGKRSTHLDLRAPAPRQTLLRLLAEADVLVQGYRPGGLAALGIGPEAAAQVRPGIVYVSLSAYGHSGPWAAKRGFDSLVQTASGFNAAEAAAAGDDQPRPLPAQALDHASGYLLAFGAQAALHRRAMHGGSWLVRVSLARTGQWLRALGRLPGGLAAPDPGFDAVRDRLEEVDSGFGRLTIVRHAAQLSATPPRWELPAMPLGSHPPVWLDRLERSD